jgi:hypothetical protein
MSDDGAMHMRSRVDPSATLCGFRMGPGSVTENARAVDCERCLWLMGDAE